MKWRWIAALLLAAGVISAVAIYTLRERSAPRAPRPPPSAAPLPSTLADPLFPDRPANLDRARSLSSSWVTAAPAAQFQYSRRASQRGGVEPCAVAQPEAVKRVQALSHGSLFMEALPSLPASGEFDLVVHLNGEGPVRRELLESKQPFVLYTLTLPLTQSYAPLFAGSGLLGQLLEQARAAVSQRFGREAKLGHLALSAWSAGFEGIRSILYQPEAERAEAVLLIDGLHAPRGNGGLRRNLEPFVRFARRAQRNERLFVITHSSIPTSGFTSTTESAHFLINELGGRPTAVRRDDGFGLELIDSFDAGGLHVRGYAGNDKADHCAQLLLLRSLFSVLSRRFHS